LRLEALYYYFNKASSLYYYFNEASSLYYYFNEASFDMEKLLLFL